MDSFNLKKLNELEGKEQYHIEISNGFAALKNLGPEVVINRAWDTFRENIKISAKESLDCCNRFDQTIARQQLCKHVQTCNNRGMSSLLSSDSVNILAAANAGNNSEYIIVTCYWATER
jgi:hypothetical protein